MKKGISRALIVDTALELLDAGGIEAVTARALAERLGVRAPALYWHVGSKQEILDEMGTEIHRRVAMELAAQEVTGDWRFGLANYARALRREYLKHRDGARTFSGTRLKDPDVLRAQEPWLRRWLETGLSMQDVAIAGKVVTAFVVGFAIEEQEKAQSQGTGYALAARDAALGAELPLVAAAGTLALAPADERFEQCLRVILDGIAVMAAASGPARRT